MKRFDGHIPEDLLARFISGDLDEALAVHIAEHLDVCPACGTRAVTEDPLFQAFAAVDDPLVPVGLAAAVLAEIDRPERAPMREIAVGGVLLAAAALLFTLGDPMQPLVHLGKFVHGLERASAVVGATGPTFLLVLVGIVGAGLYATRRSDLIGLSMHPGGPR